MEAKIPRTKMNEEIQHALEMGLPGTSKINDKTIPTFSRGELPHFAGIHKAFGTIVWSNLQRGGVLCCHGDHAYCFGRW